jgi:hypothetical protein
LPVAGPFDLDQGHPRAECSHVGHVSAGRNGVSRRVSRRLARPINSLKPAICELLDRHRFKTQAEARIAVFDFIEGFYNRRRRHSSIGYLSPIDYERLHAANPDAHQSAAVLAAVKDKPFGRPPSGAVLDRRCARRLHLRAGRDMA